jgi:hypothetical protein
MNKDALRFRYIARAENAIVKEKQLINITTFSELPKNGLAFATNERRIIIHKTIAGEEISVQYPGKESVREKGKRPWDFRPKLYTTNGTALKDLSFPDIWDDLSTLHATDGETLSLLASVFFRMAFMLDYTRTNEEYDYVDLASGGTGKLALDMYKPYFSLKLLRELQERIGKMPRNVSLEGYLLYNDLLVQNEDCKYYYRAYERNEDWNFKTGRINTLLSHISVIEFLQGGITFSEIMLRFQRGMGVAPCPFKNLYTITGGIIST